MGQWGRLWQNWKRKRPLVFFTFSILHSVLYVFENSLFLDDIYYIQYWSYIYTDFVLVYCFAIPLIVGVLRMIESIVPYVLWQISLLSCLLWVCFDHHIVCLDRKTLALCDVCHELVLGAGNEYAWYDLDIRKCLNTNYIRFVLL